MERKKIIELYNKVQAVPYYCLEQRNPNLLLKRNKGSCDEKHLFLAKEFKKLGIPVKYVVFSFDWNQLPVPKEILEKKDDSVVGHLALKIKVGGRWIYVDATWDSELEKAGFPVTKNWDGKSDTKFALCVEKIVELDEKPRMRSNRPDNREFYKALNRWLELKRA